MLRPLLVATMQTSKKGYIMKEMISNIAGGIMVFLGILMMAGSANDCDGKCIENANTIEEMILVAVSGLFFMALGALVIYKGNSK